MAVLEKLLCQCLLVLAPATYAQLAYKYDLANLKSRWNNNFPRHRDIKTSLHHDIGKMSSDGTWNAVPAVVGIVANHPTKVKLKFNIHNLYINWTPPHDRVGDVYCGVFLMFY